jgi:hypothetical protein
MAGPAKLVGLGATICPLSVNYRPNEHHLRLAAP